MPGMRKRAYMKSERIRRPFEPKGKLAPKIARCACSTLHPELLEVPNERGLLHSQIPSAAIIVRCKEPKCRAKRFRIMATRAPLDASVTEGACQYIDSPIE